MFLWVRNELAKETKSDPFTQEELDNVLSSLKENKARDPGGLVNELLSSSGAQLRISLLDLFNTIKSCECRAVFLNPMKFSAVFFKTMKFRIVNNNDLKTS